MSVKRTCAALAVASATLAAPPASATVIWDQGGIEPLVNGANFSQGSSRLADNFALATANSIQSVEIWGSHWSTGVEPAAPAFHIAIYQNAAGLPGVLIGSSDLSVISREDTGFDHNSNGAANILHYGLDLDAEILLDAGDYWLSVWLDDVPGTNFAWQRVASLGPNVGSSDGGATWGAGGGDVAFRLNGAAIGAAAVPVPAALPLLASAVSALGFVARRRAA